MKKYIYLSVLVLSGLAISSCEELLEPAYDNSLSDEMVWSNPIYAEGILLRAYVDMPEEYDFTSDMATDDALSNEKGDDANRLSGGEWSSQYNPLSTWSGAYSKLYYLNLFLENMHRVEWSYTSEVTSNMHARRMRGEALGLRAWYQFQLLQGYSGNAGGELLGFPIVTRVLNEDDLIPRGSYKACVDTIVSDCDRALALLPQFFEDTRNTEVDNAMGEKFINRIDGRAVLAIKSRVTLYAASQAYNPGNDLSVWEQAMKVSGDLIDSLGGLSKLPRNGIDYYKRNSGSALQRETELIWYTSLSESASMEEDNFPPSHFGGGRLNPSQELVDAFPASDGYPIDQSGAYDPLTPYANRDDRFEEYILYNGSTFKGAPIFTHTGDPINGINAQETSTLTGYYLRKFMNESVLLEPTRSESKHFYTYLRATEIFLNFAEAANEFGGPGYVYNGMSAVDVMHAIRKRAGINNKSYIDGLDQVGLRDAIRNERRIELCFEGHRFWDIRRWNLTDKMTQHVSGITITPDLTYNIQVVSNRVYSPHMIYGPIPYDETLKMGIMQNDGW